jgi:glycosyltransferase involved in cell wall biosynthesis
VAGSKADPRGDPAPRISVVTPSLNQGSFLEGNIRCVLEQGYPDLEHIVIDGGSTDETLEVLRRHEHVRWISERDRNMTEALNKGFRMATGEIIAWLNVDDRYPPGTLDLVARELGPDSPHRVLMGDAHYDNRIRGTEYVNPGRPFTYPEAVRWWKGPYFLNQPAIFFRRSVLDEVGYLDESLDHAMDYEFFVRLSRRHRFHYVPEVLAEVIYHPACKTADLGPAHAEALEVSRRHWGRRGSLRYYRFWSSHAAERALQGAYTAHRGARTGRALGLVLKALSVRPACLFYPTWWGVLARSCGGSRLVDAVKRLLDKGERAS